MPKPWRTLRRSRSNIKKIKTKGKISWYVYTQLHACKYKNAMPRYILKFYIPEAHTRVSNDILFIVKRYHSKTQCGYCITRETKAQYQKSQYCLFSRSIQNRVVSNAGIF
jgi:hypothetical protein